MNDVKEGLQGTSFAGVFEGNGHTIRHLTIKGAEYLGLFGQLESYELDDEVEVKDLGVVDVNIIGSGGQIGGLAGVSWGALTRCYSTGAVRGNSTVGGLVGWNAGTVTLCHTTVVVRGTGGDIGGLVGNNGRTMIDCYSSSTVSGMSSVGGLVGWNPGTVTQCYSTGLVNGTGGCVGGLLGQNNGHVTQCYSTAVVNGEDYVGGLVGFNGGCCLAGDIAQCYSIGAVSGTGFYIGGLVGTSISPVLPPRRYVRDSFWDTQTSGQAESDGGTGKTTAEMQTAWTFLEAGWDFEGETENGTEGIWKIAEDLGYPRLWWEKYSGGRGEPNDPYQIATAEDLIALGETPEDYDKHFILTADIDLDPNLPGRKVFDRAVIAPATFLVTRGFRVSGAPFAGTLDGNSHVILHLTIKGAGYLGLFGRLASGAEVRNLGVVDVNVCNPYCTGPMVAHPQPGGGLAGSNDGSVSQCYSTGTVTIIGCGVQGGVGGLVGNNIGILSQCHSNCVVTGDSEVGGLLGYHNGSAVTQCYSTGIVSGGWSVGGLVGHTFGPISTSYSSATVTGSENIGGLVGERSGIVYMTHCYSTGLVCAKSNGGGLVGFGDYIGHAARPGPGPPLEMGIASFWDIETSGQTVSDSGMGKTTAEMQTASTFLDAGWDFVGEIENGTDDIWWINEGQDYPRLWWEQISSETSSNFGE